SVPPAEMVTTPAATAFMLMPLVVTWLPPGPTVSVPALVSELAPVNEAPPVTVNVPLFVNSVLPRLVTVAPLPLSVTAAVAPMVLRVPGSARVAPAPTDHVPSLSVLLKTWDTDEKLSVPEVTDTV